MRVLIATAMYPTAENPAYGSFIKAQVDALTKEGVNTEVFILSPRSGKLKYFKAMFELHRRLSRNSFDVVHAHYGYVGMIARSQHKVPLVITFHGDDLLGTVADTRGNHTRASCFIVKVGQWIGRRAEATIVQTREMAGKLGRDANVHIIPHEVDFDTFHPVGREKARAALGLDPHKRLLLFAANPAIPVKRFALAKDVADHIRQRYPDVEMIVVYKEPQDRLCLHMNACDALLFTSFQEGSPNIVKQAMACNLPVVSTDVGDVREVIENTNWCYLCDDNVVDFTKKLGEVLHHRPRTDGHARVRRFDRSLVARRVVRVYEDALERFDHRRKRMRRNASA